MPPTHRRPCAIDTSRHFYPHAGCNYQGWLGLGNLHANGHPSGGLWRQLYCRACHGYFLETHGTIFHSKRLSVELIVRVLACLAEGLGIRATARVFEVNPNTVLQWLVEAAEQLKAFSAHVLCDMHVKQLQLDELYAVLRGVKDCEINEEQAIERLERSRHWVWTAIDPQSKLVLRWLYSTGHTETRTPCSRRGVVDKPTPNEKLSRRIEGASGQTGGRIGTTHCADRPRPRSE